MIEDKLQDHERTLAIWEKEEPKCEKGISLKLKVITGL